MKCETKQTYLRLRTYKRNVYFKISYLGNVDFMKLKKVNLILAVLLVAGAASYFFYFKDSDKDEVFKTTQLERRDLLESIEATGTLEPEDLIDVGARVSGEIISFGKDVDGRTIDYGSRVREGDILALIDDQIPQSNLLQTKASLAKAKAAVSQSKANLKLSEEQLKQAERNWMRAQKLGVSEALSQYTYDSYLSQWEVATAQIGISKAQIEQNEASVIQAEAELATAERNLGYCVIKSPVDGVIIDTVVSIGQTVVSSMNASSLFLIAKDLKRMEVWASVNEADIGNISKGQKVTFTVDAFAGEEFIGEVSNVRLNATMTQNVVTYIVEVTTDNSNGKLLPYLTANLKFEVSRADNVFAVPNSALRWKPDAKMIDPKYADTEIKGRKIWIVSENNKVRPIKVKVGLNDGAYSEVNSPDLEEGQLIVTGVETSAQASARSSGSNPFMPTPPKRTRVNNSAKQR